MAEMSETILSICIVNWNTKDLLRDCLLSIYDDPAAADWEVLVVDNASVDGSEAMVAADFSQVRLFASRENLGFVGGHNFALQEATGRHLLLLNSDTRVERGALATLVDFMEVNPGVGVLGPKLLNGDGSLQLSCGVPPSLWSEFINKLLLHNLFPFFKLGTWHHGEIRAVGWVSGACLLVRRSVVEQVGPLDPEIYMFYEDLEWCMRIRNKGWEIFYQPHSRVYHLGGQSTRKNLGEMLLISQHSLFYLFNKHFGPRQLFALRLLTMVEMVLRFLLWGGLFLMRPPRREEGRQRLRAYRQILFKCVAEKAYWAPLQAGSRERR